MIRNDGVWYMIPETAASGSVKLFRCAAFPDQWVFERDLFVGSVCDTTVWMEDGTYWFFTTVVEPRGGASQLRLYCSDSLSGEWRAHPANPISTDVRYARCAGAIFRYEGRLYRPSQDGSGEYGRNLVFNEIIELTESAYKEEPRALIRPNWMAGLVGSHTYGISGSVEMIDGKIRVLSNQVL